MSILVSSEREDCTATGEKKKENSFESKLERVSRVREEGGEGEGRTGIRLGRAWPSRAPTT
eukprot:2929022-Rhodomonas_salina.1